MKHKEYVRTAERASELVEGGAYRRALRLLRKLLSSDISDVDKAMMCLNIAVIYDKMDQPDDALAWYDEGDSYARIHGQHYVAERKAAYLAETGRHSASLAQYRGLLDRSGLKKADRARIEENINTLEEQVLGS